MTANARYATVRANQTAEKAKGWFSGFCNPAHPADSHGRCPVDLNGLHCRCACHMPPAAEVAPSPTTEVPSTPDEASAATSGPRLPGIYDDIPEAEYHADQTSLSASGAKLLIEPNSPAIFRYQMDNPKTSDALNFGKAAHARVLGAGADVVVVQKVTRDKQRVDAGDYDTKSAQEHVAEIEAEGKTPILAWQLDVIEQMAKVLSGDQEARPFLDCPGRPEVSAYFTDPKTGITRRCRYDFLPDDDGHRLIIPDYKTARAIDDHGFRKAAIDYGYDLSAAWYIDAAKALGLHNDPGLVFIAQMKVPPFLVRVIHLDADFLQIGRYRGRTALATYAECVKTNTWPGPLPAMGLKPPVFYIDQNSEALR